MLTTQENAVSAPVPAAGADPGTDARFHSLDAVRAFALLLGVVFHAAESFGKDNWYWAVVDSSPSSFLEMFRFACHSFRMELFFLIAGFFGRLLVQRRGMGGFAANRARRILGPLVVGWLALYPLLVLIWLWGASVSGRLGQMGVPEEARGMSPLALLLGFILTGGFVGKFDLTHLWFLYQLLVIYVLVMGGRALLSAAGMTTALAARLDGALRFFCRSPGSVVVLAALTLPLLLLMKGWDVSTPKESLVPDLPVTALYAGFFLFGWGLHRQQDLLGTFGPRWRGRILGAVVICAALLIAGETIPFRSLTPRQVFGVRVGFTLLYASMMWLFVVGFFGLLNRVFAQPNRWVRYTSDASYWVYLVHLPLVVALQIVVARWMLPWPVKYALILGVALPLLFLSYHYLVRGSWIGVALNGRRYPRRWPWREP